MSEEAQVVEQNTSQNQEQSGGVENNQASENNSSFDFNTFNDRFETSFENEGSLKEALGRANEYDSVISERDRYKQESESALNKYNSVVKSFDPEVVGDKDTRALIELQKKTGKDIGLISQIRSADIKSIDPLDAIVLADKLSKDISGISDSDIKEGVLKSLGMSDADLSDLTGAEKYAIQERAHSAKEKLAELQGYEPKELDIEAQWKNSQAQSEALTKELTEGLTPISQEISKEYNGFSFSSEDVSEEHKAYEYKIDGKLKEAYTEKALQYAISAGLDPKNEQARVEMSEYVKANFYYENMEKIVADAIRYGQSIGKEGAEKLVDNGQSMEKTGKERENTGEGTGNLIQQLKNRKK